MNTHTANLKRTDILGNGDRSSDQEILTATLKRWGRRLRYCSVFAAIPALVASQVAAARSEAAKKPGASVTERTPMLPHGLNKSGSNAKLLKRQSNFLLPHQKGNFAMPAASAGNDDCPGGAIPGGNYTAAAPYIESGDTTGANDTVTGLRYYYYYSASGPDRVYSFTLTGRGPNPQIEVSATSGAYKPLIYVLQGGSSGTCPAGTGNTASNVVAVSDSRWTTGSSTATLDNSPMNYLPLNVPLYLFVDSARNDASGSGAYTIRMQDVTIASPVNPNPIDSADVFVSQHYRDFLNREPDSAGLAFWTDQITSCGTDQGCIEVKRINDSASFFLSIEFQESGYLAYRFHKSAFGNLPGAPVPVRLNDFLLDAQQIGKGVIVNQAGWQAVLDNNKQTYAMDFVQRSRFVSTYPTSMSSEQFVDALFANAGVVPSASDRTAAINEFAFSATTADVAARARALRRVAENSTLAQQEFNRALVLMQYFGYLRRNPNDAPESTLSFQGYDFWLNKLDTFKGNYIDAEMVKAFLSSAEYRQRFGQ